MTATTSDVKIFLLGDFRVEYKSKIVKLPTKQTKSVLAYLVLSRNRPVRREKLASLFWGRRQFADGYGGEDDDEQSEENIERNVRASLRTALSAIRKELGNDIFLDDVDVVQINPSRLIWTDAEEFANAVKKFLAESSTDARLDELALYKGDLLNDFEDDPDEAWIVPERQALRDLYRDALLRMAQTMRSQGDYEKAIGYAQEALTLEPYNEAAYQHLMLCHFMLGQKSVALEQYRKLERALQDEFGKSDAATPSSETRNLLNRIKQAKSRTASLASLTNLPTSLTLFIGRAQETETLKDLLTTKPDHGTPTRLITITGTGGCGKTRLAVQVASLVLDQYQDGVWWVGLESLEREQALLPQTVAKVLGVREQSEHDLIEILVHYLQNKQILLVLDNCEHLVAACADLCARLLSACPALQILATSREVLRVTGELDFYLQPFAIPPPEKPASLDTIKHYDAVRFFVDRALVERPGFALTNENAPSVTQICQCLDGIPLAIELAAARMKNLSVESIAIHLNDRFTLLSKGPRTPTRHQTLRAAIDWSYNLLDLSEQRLLCELSVFAGWFSLQAGEAVQWDEDNQDHVLEKLSSLVDKSLVVLEIQTSGDARYRLLNTIREYAREKLQANQENADAAFARMAQYYLQFAKHHQKDYVLLEQEWDNVSIGIRVMHRQKRWSDVIEYGYALTETCFARGFYTEARRLYPWVCEAAEQLEEQEAYIASTLNWARAYTEQGFYPEAREILTRLLRICKEAADQAGIASAQVQLAWVEIEESHYDEAQKLLEESRTIREQLGDLPGVAEVLLSQSRIDYRFNRFDESEQLAHQALDILKTLAPNPQVINALRRLTLIARMRKNLALAEQYCQEAIEVCETLSDRGELASMLFVLAQICKSRGNLELSRQYLEQSCSLMETIGAQKSKAYVLDFLGSVYTELQDYETAFKVGMLSLDLLRELHDDTGIIFACLHLGKTLQQMNRIQEACRLWAEALPTADKLNHPRASELRELLAQHCPGLSS